MKNVLMFFITQKRRNFERIDNDKNGADNHFRVQLLLHKTKRNSKKRLKENIK